MVVQEGQLKGSFKGFRRRGTTFEFRHGKNWKQNEYKYLYHYAYSPNATVIRDGGRYYLIVEGVSERVEVKRA